MRGPASSRSDRGHSRFLRRPGLRRLDQGHLGSAVVFSVALHGAVLFGFMPVVGAPPGPGLLEVFPVAVATEEGGEAPTGGSQPAQPVSQPEPVVSASVRPSLEESSREEWNGSGPARSGRSEPPRNQPRQAASPPARASISSTPKAPPPPPPSPPASEDVVLTEQPQVLAGAGASAVANVPPGDRIVSIAPSEPRLADVLAPVTTRTEATAPSASSDLSVTAPHDPHPGLLAGRERGDTLKPSEPPPRREVAQATPGHAPSGARPAGSSLGLGLDMVRVQLEGPRSKVTHESGETVSGRITGGAAKRLVLHVNDTAHEVKLDHRAFQTSVALTPGLNRLRAVVTGAGGIEAEDVIAIEYVPPPVASGIALTSPHEGLTLGPEDPPLIVVEGEVEDRSATEVWVVASDRRIPVAAREGRFRLVVPALEPATRVWAEARPNGGPLQRSRTVTVHAAPSRSGPALLVMEGLPETAGAEVDVSAIWRGAPGSLEAPAVPVSLKPLRTSPGAPRPAAFSLGTIKPGVYTLALTVRTPVADASVRPTLYVAEDGAVKSRVLKPVSLAVAGRVVVARVLLPQGVLWDQDDWFTGKSESADAITKFRFPEGIAWAERKADLP